MKHDLKAKQIYGIVDGFIVNSSEADELEKCSENDASAI